MAWEGGPCKSRFISSPASPPLRVKERSLREAMLGRSKNHSGEHSSSAECQRLGQFRGDIDTVCKALSYYQVPSVALRGS